MIQYVSRETHRRGLMEKVKVALTLDKDLLQWVDKVSKQKRVTRSAFINHVIWVLKRENITLDKDIVLK